MKRRKYSELLIQEAVKLRQEVGAVEASRITGIHIRTIHREWDKFRDRNGLSKKPNGAPQKYSQEQKKSCIKLAIKYIETGHIVCRRKAFTAAGKILKVNGMSIYQQWIQGDLRGMTTQHSGKDSVDAVGGASIQEARPQSHLWTRQHDPDPAMRPPPRIIKRRKVTSDTVPSIPLPGHKAQR